MNSIVTLRATFYSELQHWSDRRILTAMGYLNNLLYCAAKAAGAILNDRKIRFKGFGKPPERSKQIRIHRRRMRKLAAQDTVEVTVPITYTQSYLKQFWHMTQKLRASARIKTIREVREELAETFGLFSFEAPKFGKNPGRKSTSYDALDLRKALLMYESLEEIYLARRDRKLEALPRHRGSVMRLLYNWVFRASPTGNRAFRRPGDPDAGTFIDAQPKYELGPDAYYGFIPIPKGGGMDIHGMSEDELDGLLPY